MGGGKKHRRKPNLLIVKQNNNYKRIVSNISFAQLPIFVVSHIYSFCTPVSLCTLSGTCRSLREYAKKAIIRAKIEKKVLIEQPVGGAKNGKIRLIPTQCWTCNKQCHSKNGLTSHILNSETCFLPYKCPRCQLSYFTKNSRLQHMRQFNHYWTEQELEEKKKAHDKKLKEQKERENKDVPTPVSSTAVVVNKLPFAKVLKKNVTVVAEISPEFLKIGDDIGDGPGVVYKGFLQSNPVRVTSIRGVSQEGELKFKKTAIILKSISNPRIVPFIGTCKFSRNFHIVNEYIEGTTLHEYLKHFKFLKLGVVRSIATDIAQAMRVLHSNNPPIAHGDLRPVNIIIDKQNRAKVINFGLNELYPRKLHNDAIAYIAPELISEDPSYSTERLSEAMDVYSFAMVLSVMLRMEEPFLDKNVLQIARILYTGGPGSRPAISGKLPRGLRFLINKCWNQDPLCRPRFKKILKELKDDETWQVQQPSKPKV